MRTRNYVAQPNWTNTVGWATSKNGHELADTIIPTADTNDAVAIIVGRISSSHLMISPSGNYNPDYAKSISTAKFQFTLAPPGPGVFQADFNTAIDAIEAVQDTIASTTEKKFFVLKDGQNRVLRFSQAMFEPKDTDSTNDDNAITSWPIPAAHHNNLQGIMYSHRVLPLIAYNMNDTFISPDQTTIELEGALVELYFGLKHFHIANISKNEPYNLFTGVIEQIIVLEKPAAKRPSQFRENITKGPTCQKTADTEKTAPGKLLTDKKKIDVHPYTIQKNHNDKRNNAPTDDNANDQHTKELSASLENNVINQEPIITSDVNSNQGLKRKTPCLKAITNV